LGRAVRGAACCALVVGLVAAAFGAEVTSGLQAGKTMPAFDVIDLTGPFVGAPSVCYA